MQLESSVIFRRPFFTTCLGAHQNTARGSILADFAFPTPVNSVDPQGDPSNVILSYTYAGPKATLKQFVVPAGAQLREVKTSTYASEAVIRVTSGATVLMQEIRPITSGNYSTPFGRSPTAPSTSPRHLRSMRAPS